MTRYFVLYHLEKLILWFLATPVVVGLLIMPFTLFGQGVTIFLVPILLGITSVLTIFLEQTATYQQMLRAMPIPSRTLVQVKFLFSALILGYQFLLLTIFVSNQANEIVLPFLAISFALCILLINLLLLYHFFTGQQKQIVIIAAIFILLPLVDVQPFDALLFSNETAMILLLITLIITYLNYRLCLYFAKTKDAQ